MIGKPIQVEAAENLQERNRNWWANNPMSYDWRGTNQETEGSVEFFNEIDRRLFNASPLFRGSRPFERLIPFDTLHDKCVLEIGCGLGGHTELFAANCRQVKAIDITERAVELAKRRLALRGLSADIRQMDAEQIAFDDCSFDFVWSWGVIHHSANTDQIVKEVARVLKPGGEFRLMVYNRQALDSWMKLVRGYLTGKPLKGMTTSDILSYYTDGYIARFYTRRDLQRLLISNGFEVRSVSTLGQTSELVPLPGTGPIGHFKRAVVARLPDGLVECLLRSIGSFLFAVASKCDSVSAGRP